MSTFLLIAACSTPTDLTAPNENPLPISLDRIQSQTQNNVTVHVSIPSADKVETYFGVEMARSSIQPIWIRIENNSDVDYWLQPFAIDKDYYSPNEAALLTGKKLDNENFLGNKRFIHNNAMPFFSRAGSINEGYIYATPERGGRFVDIHLSGHLKVVRIRFAILLPTQKFDYERSGLREMYAKRHEFPNLSIDELREYLRDSIPCCTTNKEGKGKGDPLNIVLIGSGEVGIAALSASGWKFTEAITIDSIRRMIGAAIEENAFPTAPISPLYAFGRIQDVALQRGRSNINQRNHMRLWLAPVLCENEPVWVGQISRDIGVKVTTKSPTLTTHVIDPNVDDAREYLLHSLLHSQSVSQFAFVKGVGEVWEENLRRNLTDDPYITDGMRMVLWLSAARVSAHQAIDLGWNASVDPALILKSQSELKAKGEGPMIDPLLDQ